MDDHLGSEIEHEVAELRVRVAMLERQVRELQGAPTQPVVRPPRPAPTQPPLAPPEPTAPITERPTADPRSAGTERVKRLVEAFSVQTSEAILKWAGVGLVLLAVAFAVGLAIERGWITPTMRIAAASTVSVALFVIGQSIRSRRPVFAETLQGAAFVSGFFTAWGAIPMGVVSGEVGFLAMVGVALAALVASYLLDSPPIAILGLLGGAATPFMIRRGLEDPEFLAVFAALIAVATLVVFAATGWRTLLVGTAITAWSMLALAAGESSAAAVVWSIGIVGAALWMVPLVRAILEENETVRDRPTHRLEEALQPLLKSVPHRFAIAAPLVSLLLAQDVDLSRYEWAAVIGAVAAVFAVAALALNVGRLARFAYTQLTVTALLGSLAITLALDGDVLMISLPLQATALWLIGRKLDHVPMQWQSHVLYGITMAALVVRAALMVWEGDFETAALVTDIGALALLAGRSVVDDRPAAFYGPAVHLTTAIYLFGPLEGWALLLGFVILAALTRLASQAAIGNFTTSTLINQVVMVLGMVLVAAQQYDDPYELEWVPVAGLALASLAAFSRLAPGRYNHQEAALSYLGLLALVPILFGDNDAAITASWTAIGLTTLAAGFRLDLSLVQKTGWLTLGGAAAKLMLHDLESTEALIRIGLFFGIGLAFLGLAYLLPTHLAPTTDKEAEPTTTS